jgi:hypothetical protein
MLSGVIGTLPQRLPHVESFVRRRGWVQTGVIVTLMHVLQLVPDIDNSWVSGNRRLP